MGVEGMKILLDLFCCQGGASYGYIQAGYATYGVDKDPQPNYPWSFERADAVQFVYDNVEWIREKVSLVHASPPCQFGTKCQRIQGNDHPNLIPATREALEYAGVPYVIENVEDVREHLKAPVTLCGTMFRLRTYRHRLFEVGGGVVLEQPAHPRHVAPNAKMGRPVGEGEFYHAVGNFSGVGMVRADMGMEWATREGLREAVPPAYTEFIGRNI
jgi:DNA (cytosine-5)-methyltransferase 1